jgi:hypothetical protein
MKKLASLILFTLILAAPMQAQNEDYLPHVTQLRAESRNNLIRLTWADSPDARGPVFIFRSTRPFRGSIPAHIRPVVVRYGEQYYIDDSDDLENLFYFIAASDVSGRRYDVIIPQVNSTNVNMSGVPAAPVPARAAPEPIQGISNLRASLDGEMVMITFHVEGQRRNAVLYRSMRPIRQPQDLLNAVIVQSGMDSAFIDFPVPGISWYYAAIYEDDILSGNMGIRPGVNATISPVIISAKEPAQALRPMPLPAMSLRNTLSDSFFLPNVINNMPLREETIDMLRNSQIPSREPPALKTPRIFTVDLQAPLSGEDSALFQIVSEFFVKRDWEGARVSLLHYLTLPRSKDVEARARFYLGQTLYFTGNFRGALFEFLSIRPFHPVEANIWIDVILTAMVH